MIKINNLTAFYGNTKVLDDITFSIKKGQNISIVGLNGSGKTTLLRCIINSIEYSGKIYIDDKNIKEIKRKELSKRVAMLSQTMYINFNYTVFDTVMMGRYIHQKNGIFLNNQKSDIEIALNAIKTLGIDNLKTRYIDTLSGGQLKRVFLAKIIAQDPDIILLDEPTNHLDLKYQVEFINFLKEWAYTKNKTIIGVLHDINQAMILTEYMAVMQEGRLIMYDTVSNILKSEILNNIYGMDIKKFMLENLKRWQNIL